MVATAVVATLRLCIGCDAVAATLWLRRFNCDAVVAMLWLQRFHCDAVAATLWLRLLTATSRHALIAASCDAITCKSSHQAQYRRHKAGR